MQQSMSRADEKVRPWVSLPACAAAILMILGATLTCGAATIGAPQSPAELNSWPTFDQPTADALDQTVLHASVPQPDGIGDEAPATVPLPPAVLTGGAILGMQWLAMGLTKNRKI